VKSDKVKTSDDSKWPKVYSRTYPSGQVACIVDLGIVPVPQVSSKAEVPSVTQKEPFPCWRTPDSNGKKSAI